jgi:hypothetical protein
MISTDEGITTRPSDGDLLNANHWTVEEHKRSQTHTPSSFRMFNGHRPATGDMTSEICKKAGFLRASDKSTNQHEKSKRPAKHGI